MSKTKTNKEQVLPSLPLWKCHKVVQAAPMRAIYAADREGGWNVYLDGVVASVFIAPGTFSRYMPVLGDYLVIYDDGHISVSPKTAFEEGYSPIEESESVEACV